MASSDKADNFKDFISTGVDYRNRMIFFGDLDDDSCDGEFTWRSVEIACRAIIAMTKEHPKTPIDLYVNSVGGDAYQMLRLYDCIQQSSCQIRFFGNGKICSSAAWIMCCCDERYISPNAEIMLHHGAVSLPEGNVVDVEIDSEQNAKVHQQMLQILVNNSRMPLVFWKEVLKRDYYITPEEAVILGIADEIIEPKKRGNLRKKRQHKLSQKIDKRQLNKVVKQAFEKTKIGSAQSLKIEIHIPHEEVDDSLTIEFEPSPQSEFPTFSDPDPLTGISIAIDSSMINDEGTDQ